jgi:predicted AAA+ superfamily ATPase
VVHFLFGINKRLQIFCQAPKIELSAPDKQFFSQLCIILDGQFASQIIKINPGFSSRKTTSKRSRPISKENFSALLQFGGFPEPYLKNNTRFYNRWKSTRLKLFFREDLRETTRVFEVGQVEILAELLRHQAGQLVSYASLARKVRASEDSIRRWISVLASLYFCFQIRPWSKNISRSILKNPKIYLTDWSIVENPGAKHENFIACHLQKAVNWWQDLGLVC